MGFYSLGEGRAHRNIKMMAAASWKMVVFAQLSLVLLLLKVLPAVEARGERPTNIIKLGAILPLTLDGTLYHDAYGDSVSKLAAFVMGVRDVNLAYGKKYNISVHFTVLDSQGHYGLAAQAVTTLATNGFPNLAAMGFGSPSVHAIVGSDDNVMTQAIGNSVVDYNLLSVAYGSDVSALSRGSLFPNSTFFFLCEDRVDHTRIWITSSPPPTPAPTTPTPAARVFPSMGYESAALADFLFHQYHVSRMVVLYTTDIYGQDALNVFQVTGVC